MDESVIVKVEGHEDSRRLIEDRIKPEIEKLSRILPVQEFIIHVDLYRESGSRKKYSLKGRLMTGKGMFFAQEHAWEMDAAVRGLLTKLEREIIKEVEKSREARA